MAREIFKNLPDTTTPLSASKLNGLFNGEEPMGSIVVEDIECRQLFDKNDVVKYRYLLFDTGVPTYDANMSYTQKYIEVEPITAYTVSADTPTMFLIAQYDENKNFIISNIQNDSNKKFTFNTSENAKYVRLSVGISVLDSYLFQKGSDPSLDYETYKKFGYNSQESMGEIVVDDISCKNKLNENGVIVNGVIGFLVDVKAGETYTISSNLPIYWFKITDYNDSPDKGAEWLRADGYTEYTFTCTESYPYVFVGINQSNPYNLPTSLSDYANYNLQIEKGDKATPYTPYKNFEGRTDIITGQEMPTNEYIDGKRVYVKRINLGTLPNASNVTVATGLTMSNVNVVKITGIAKAGDGATRILPYIDIWANGNGTTIYITSDGNLNFYTNGDWSSYTGYVEIYYTKSDTSSVSTTSLEEEVI